MAPPLGLLPTPPPPRPIPDRDHSTSPSPPPPSKPSAIQTNNKNFGIKMSLGSKPPPFGSSVSKQAPKPVSSVFNNDSSDEEEEIPHEARMKMRNVGRETITSSGPNSFGKTRQGFVDSAKLFERQMQMAMDDVSNDKK